MNSTPRLILASDSPRRKQLLSEAGFQFESGALPFDESYPPNIVKGQIGEYLATKKNEIHRDHYDDDAVIITADTIVLKGDLLLEKPKDEKVAFDMIRRLSGACHQVITGVCVSDPDKRSIFSEVTQVFFRHLTDDEINHYIENFKPFDKAGAYGIQEWIGMIGITHILGSYYNVMGLPVEKLYTVLKEQYAIVPLPLR